MFFLQEGQYTNIGGSAKFFLICLSHESLENLYKTNFAMMQYHKYSLTELEDMIPWERQVYVALLKQHIEEENERMKKQQR